MEWKGRNVWLCGGSLHFRTPSRGDLLYRMSIGVVAVRPFICTRRGQGTVVQAAHSRLAGPFGPAGGQRKPNMEPLLHAHQHARPIRDPVCPL